MAEVGEQAENIVWHGCLVPEVHHYSVVFGVSSSSMDEEPLVQVSVEEAFIVIHWVAITSPQDISAVLGVDIITPVAAEDSVPAGSSVNIIAAGTAIQDILATISVELILVVFSE